MAGGRGRSFTSWLKRTSEEQVPEEFCPMQSLRGPCYLVTLPSPASLGSSPFSQMVSPRRDRINEKGS